MRISRETGLTRADGRTGAGALVSLVGIAVLLTTAPGHAPLAAQEDTAELTGCYDITVGEWYVQEYGEKGPSALLLHRRSDSLDFELPSRIEFAGPYGRRDLIPPRTQIVVPEGALPSIHYITVAWIADDSLRLVFSTGYAGVDAGLTRSGDGWAGTATTFVDYSGEQVNARSIDLIPANCDFPALVSIDAMRSLARSVELDAGHVITLGKPLPDAVQTVAVPDRSWRLVVLGQTTALFGTTDSIQIGMGGSPLYPNSRVVQGIELFYPGHHFETLEARFRDVFGSPNLRAQTWGNRITRMYLLVAGRNGGARVTLQNLNER